MNLYVLMGLALLGGVALGFSIGQEVARRVMEPHHLAELKRMAILLQYGTLTLEPARKLEGPPDAMQRAQKRIHDDKVKNGTAVILQMYKDKGLQISEEEARLQVEAMIAGRDPISA